MIHSALNQESAHNPKSKYIGSGEKGEAGQKALKRTARTSSRERPWPTRLHQAVDGVHNKLHLPYCGFMDHYREYAMMGVTKCIKYSHGKLQVTFKGLIALLDEKIGAMQNETYSVSQRTRLVLLVTLRRRVVKQRVLDNKTWNIQRI